MLLPSNLFLLPLFSYAILLYPSENCSAFVSLWAKSRVVMNIIRRLQCVHRYMYLLAFIK